MLKRLDILAGGMGVGQMADSKSIIQPTWNKKLSILTLSILDNSTSSRCICHSEGRNSLPIAHPRLVTSRCCSQLDSSTGKYYYVKGKSSLVAAKQFLLFFLFFSFFFLPHQVHQQVTRLPQFFFRLCRNVFFSLRLRRVPFKRPAGV